MKIKLAKSELIHFVGIGGIGMSGLSLIMKGKGFRVQGSDISNNKNIERLKKEKIKVSIGHKRQNIDKSTILVISSAIKKNNPELVEAKKKQLPIYKRGEMLANIVSLTKNIVVVGSHGKTTTTSLIDSILKANEKGKIKIKKIDDNTASKVEILIYLPSGISPDKTIDALYAFTNCEVSISPLSCVIEDNKPCFMGVSEILTKSTDNTAKLLKNELEIRLRELEDQWHNFSLERIFIENKIYRDIEKEETWDGVLFAIRNGIKPFINNLKREVSNDDISRLTRTMIYIPL